MERIKIKVDAEIVVKPGKIEPRGACGITIENRGTGDIKLFLDFIVKPGDSMVFPLHPDAEYIEPITLTNASASALVVYVFRSIPVL
jgi:hypothetical protein